jgi:hypothetical protein
LVVDVCVLCVCCVCVCVVCVYVCVYLCVQICVCSYGLALALAPASGLNPYLAAGTTCNCLSPHSIPFLAASTTCNCEYSLALALALGQTLTQLRGQPAIDCHPDFIYPYLFILIYLSIFIYLFDCHPDFPPSFARSGSCSFLSGRARPLRVPQSLLLLSSPRMAQKRRKRLQSQKHPWQKDTVRSR